MTNATSSLMTVSTPHGRLVGNLVRSGGNRSDVVLFVHGFGSNRRGEKALALRDACARHGWHWAAFDFHGHGDSTGAMLDLLGSGLQADLEAIKVRLAEEGLHRLFLVGSSMGGWASSWYALTHPEEVPAVVLIAPAFHFLQRRWEACSPDEQVRWQTEGKLRLSSDWLDAELSHELVAERDRFDPDELARGWHTPALIFHGMHDEVVPWRDSVGLLERTSFADLQLRLLRDGDHRLTAWRDEMAEEACRFFARWR